MPTIPKRHTQSPRLYVSESLVYAPDSTIQVGDPYGIDPSTGMDYPWRDLVGAIDVKGTGSADPSWSPITGLGGMYAYQFSATVMKEVWVMYHIDHDYAAGTPIYLHCHWVNDAASPNTGTVRWGFEYTVAKGHQQQAFPATTTVYAQQNCSATRYMHHIAEVSLADAVPATNLEPDSILMVRIFRDAATDTCTDAVDLLLADCHYQAAKFGTKNKAPNFNT